MSIGFVEFKKANATSIVATNAISAGDLIIAATQGTAAGTPTCSDNVNAGNYNFIGTFTTLTADIVNLFWIKCNAAGTPTISITGVAVDRVAFSHFNGFLSNATVLTADIAHGTTATATTYDSTAFTCSQSTEHACGFLDGGGQNSASNSAQFSNRGGDSNLRGFDTVGGTGPFSSGTSVDLSGTFSVATNSFALIVGFYDAQGAAVGKPIGGLVSPTVSPLRPSLYRPILRGFAPAQLSVSLGAQTATGTAGSLTAEIDVSLTNQSVTSSQGSISTLNEALLGRPIGGFVSPILGPLANNLFRPIARSQSTSGTVLLTTQTITSTAGTVSATDNVALTALSITPNLGTLTATDQVALTADTATFSAGTITATTSGATVSLTGQSVTSSMGALVPQIFCTLGQQTFSFTQGSVNAPITLASLTLHVQQGFVGLVTVPDVRGLDVSVASPIMTAAGGIADVIYEDTVYPLSLAQGIVFAQVPDAGSITPTPFAAYLLASSGFMRLPQVGDAIKQSVNVVIGSTQ